MKIRSEVSPEKLRGGFYSPDALVDRCLDRIRDLANGRTGLRVLEPSAGDGAFIRGLARHPLGAQVEAVTAIELLAEEAAKCSRSFVKTSFAGRVLETSAITWSLDESAMYDVAVGNPPFVRFQFLVSEDKTGTARLAEKLGLPLARVGNLWIPLLLAALTRLAEGGTFAFIIPAECLTGTSAKVFRRWLTANVEDLRFDLFPPGSFPDVLQEVVILSGTRRSESRTLGLATAAICDHARDAGHMWHHTIASDTGTWTGLLLTPPQVDAINEARTIPAVSLLGTAAKFEVAAVTGANDYFCVDEATVDQYELRPWAVPLLPRVRHAEGLEYRWEDFEATVRSGAKTYLLDFSKERPDPTHDVLPKKYIALGTKSDLHTRYKTSIREPWYRVPHMRTEPMMLSKRSHWYPRVILNSAQVVSTDTIYRGFLRPEASVAAPDFVAAFHNSLTLVSAEMEGRSFGGGVLELVPSEVSRLLVPLVPGFASELPLLDAIARSGETQRLVEMTDKLLVSAGVGFSELLLEHLRDARQTLLQRRLDRTSTGKRVSESQAG